ncbi:enoyl-CoA hydratase/isomerase family protein [Methylobacterium nodulans]|uniref:Enoyl-CoA hydratase/isomerase n=1 Tax=Methylobacterium nodulans (strain LMG 21967 / CNCM I-2342 / ORS 2060) TaxID=460265 RepID=B8IWZ9_METNO|nr:enoyl-CoA hydratase/isomerase family protein [Methylobacterium nodulans]ACL63040.1 Enoyl-CoA hydratase/isomerase [Methylobacterium nodulans ORS 2060]
MVRSETRGSVAIVTLDRAARRNALGTESMRALSAALRAADADESVRAIVLTGAPPAFCAGSDLKELGGLSIPAMCDHEAETATVARSIGFLTKPVVAAVEGYALGGGFILAVSCDVVVSAENARWHLAEVTNGWLPVWGLQALLARVGPVRARLLTWGVESIDGREALRLGVADYTAEAGGALDRALAVAQGLAKLPPEAVTSTKRFFEPFVMADAERLDNVASRMFARDCESASAQATLARFTVRS